MTEIAEENAQKDLPALLDRVQAGESILITRDGQPVAWLDSAVRSNSDIAQTIAELDRLRKGNRVDGMTIRQLIDEGRKY